MMNTALTIFLLFLAGFFAQWLAWRSKLPAILFLLAVGIVAGPVTHWLSPEELLGDLLFPCVSLAVAVILFEGALTLKLEEVRNPGLVVRRLVTGRRLDDHRIELRRNFRGRYPVCPGRPAAGFNAMTTLPAIIIAVCTMTALTACTAEKNAQVSLRNLHQGLHCGDQTAGVRWLTQDSLPGAMKRPGAGQHLGDPTTTSAPADGEKLLLVSLGQKNSGGYGIALTRSQTEILNEAIELPLEIQQPAPGTMQTMQLTNPCIVIGLRGDGYKRVDAGSLGSVTAED